MERSDQLSAFSPQLTATREVIDRTGLKEPVRPHVDELESRTCPLLCTCSYQCPSVESVDNLAVSL